MSRRDDELEGRPERVIILDADDPMTEIHGRFVWQEEHDRVVEEVRRQAFADGYAGGQHDAAENQTPMRFELRRRRNLWSRPKRTLAILAAVCLMLALPVLVFNT